MPGWDRAAAWRAPAPDPGREAAAGASPPESPRLGHLTAPPPRRRLAPPPPTPPPPPPPRGGGGGRGAPRGGRRGFPWPHPPFRPGRGGGPPPPPAGRITAQPPAVLDEHGHCDDRVLRG